MYDYRESGACPYAAAVLPYRNLNDVRPNLRHGGGPGEIPIGCSYGRSNRSSHEIGQALWRLIRVLSHNTKGNQLANRGRDIRNRWSKRRIVLRRLDVAL